MSAPDKDALRRHVRALRREHVASLSPSQRTAELRAAAHNVARVLAGFERLGSYVPTAYEIDPAACEDLVAAPPLLPWFEKRTPEMIFRRAGALERGPWGMMQPSAECEEAQPDALIVPLVAATRSGHRVGQGGGHYDRYLERRRSAGDAPLTIGLAWDCQIVGEFPIDPWDEPLDYIATSGGLYGRHD